MQFNGTLRRDDHTLVKGVDEAWDKFDSFKQYDVFTNQWLQEVRRILKPQGTLWGIGSYHNIFRIGARLQDLGYWILNDVVWRKTNPMPNFRGLRFTNAHETLIWATRDQKATDYTFNYLTMKTSNEDLQMRSDWLLPVCHGAERVKNETGKTIHPTQKPESLLYRILLSSSKREDVILDPFFGTRTTGVVAKKLRRHFISIEKDVAYVEVARKRIAQVKPCSQYDIEIMRSARQEERIPFGSLVEGGLLKP